MNVELVRWPSEHHRREELVAAGVARLLLVETGAEAPSVHDPLEDWVRLPVESSDLQARLDTLSFRSRSQASAAPRLDSWGVLHFRGCEVCLGPLESRLAGLLVGSFGAVVRRSELLSGGWPGADPGRNALDVHILRLRRRLEPLELSIRTVRNRGYMLAPAMANGAVTGSAQRRA
ncbi:MAG: helix-turn-helix domain-containing protein [Acidimicrobiales bacterium]